MNFNKVEQRKDNLSLVKKCFERDCLENQVLLNHRSSGISLIGLSQLGATVGCRLPVTTPSRPFFSVRLASGRMTNSLWKVGCFPYSALRLFYPSAQLHRYGIYLFKRRTDSKVGSSSGPPFLSSLYFNKEVT